MAQLLHDHFWNYCILMRFSFILCYSYWRRKIRYFIKTPKKKNPPTLPLSPLHIDSYWFSSSFSCFSISLIIYGNIYNIPRFVLFWLQPQSFQEQSKAYIKTILYVIWIWKLILKMEWSFTRLLLCLTPLQPYSLFSGAN